MLDLTPLLLLVGCSVAPAPMDTPRPVAAATTIADLKLETPSPAAWPAPALPAGRDKAIAAYRSYLERYPDAPERREVTRRLADLLLESAAESRATVSPRGKPAAQATSIASVRYAEAIDIYETLLRQESNGKLRGELLYQLARAYEESGQPAKAMGLLTRMAKAPHDAEAAVYGDAQFRRGELLFAQKSFSEAEQAYRKVVALGGQTPIYLQSLYKLGWSSFKQGRCQEAVEVFFTLLDHQLPPGTDVTAQMATFSRAEREQLTDVFRAVALCFSRAGGATALVEHLGRSGPRSYQDRLYRSLGELYLTEERYSDAAETYLALARQLPLSTESPELYTKVIEIYQQAGFTERAVET
ncbi:MAG: tetratricopeptide repeat protein, partial [Gammaproteobacteria bacterium]